MSQPDQKPSMAPDFHDELVDSLIGTVTNVIAKLTPLTRLRLLAFMHMIEHPEAMTAEMEFQSSGRMRLTLANASVTAQRLH